MVSRLKESQGNPPVEQYSPIPNTAPKNKSVDSRVQEAWSQIKAGEDIQTAMNGIDVFNRGFLSRCFDHIVSTVNAIHFGITRNMIGKCAYVLGFRPEFCDLSKGEGTNWKPESQGLVLMLHGLRGHPSQFDGHVRELRKQGNLDLRVPFITNKGDDDKDILLSPLKNLITDYINTQQTKNKDQPIKICLIGISNGGRLSVMLTQWMAENYPEAELLTLANASVLHGTNISSTPPFKLSKFHSAIVKDFKYDNKDKEWVGNAVSNLPEKFFVHAYSATSDSMVYPIGASMLPPKNKNVVNHFYRFEGHISILQGAQSDHLQKISAHFLLNDSDALID